MADIHTITLTTHAYGGESLGRLADGRAVFVPYALPGETVRSRLVEEKPRYARAELVEVLEASPERITPRCQHFTTCGGCHYQHMHYEAQLEAKREILRDQLKRIGKLSDPPVKDILPSPQSWNYRNHVQFHLTEGGRLGFQAPRSNQVVLIEECHLPEKGINAIWPLLEMERIPGLDRVHLRVGRAEDLMVILESSEPEPIEFNVDLPLSAIHLGPAGYIVLAGDDHILMEVLERPFRVSGGSFFQVNTLMAVKMVSHILKHLSLNTSTTIIEAFCGVGLFSAFLAPHVKRLAGIEASTSACDDFIFNLDEFDNVELYEGDVEDILPNLDLNPDVVLVDPPRSGLSRNTLDAIRNLGPTHLVYVSCDPATLARDSRRLTAGGYRLTQITPFDLFPQTYHIESVSFWQRE